MSALKCACPRCAKVLKLPAGEQLPARVKCPRCATRFLLSTRGTVELSAVAPVGSQPAATFPATPAELASFGSAALALLPQRRRRAGARWASRRSLLVRVAASVLLLGTGIGLWVCYDSGSGKEDSPARAPEQKARATEPKPEEAPQPDKPKRSRKAK